MQIKNSTSNQTSSITTCCSCTNTRTNTSTNSSTNTRTKNTRTNTSTSTCTTKQPQHLFLPFIFFVLLQVQVIISIQSDFVECFSFSTSTIHHYPSRFHAISKRTSSSSSSSSSTISTRNNNSAIHKRANMMRHKSSKMESISTSTSTPYDSDIKFNTMGKEKTLASSFIIYINDDTSTEDDNTDTNTDTSTSLIWTLIPLKNVVKVDANDNNDNSNDTKTKIGVGSLAIQALKSTFNTSTTSSSNEYIKLICHLQNDNDDDDDDDDDDHHELKIDVTVENHMVLQQQQQDEDDMNMLLATLSRIMIQMKMRTFLDEQQKQKQQQPHTSCPITISLPSYNQNNNNNNNNNNSNKEIIQHSTCDIILSPTNNKDGHTSSCSPSLYESLLQLQLQLPPETNLNTIEMSDMVDSSGNVLGSVPRLLVHKFNLLHRGIGIVVCREEHIDRNNQGERELQLQQKQQDKDTDKQNKDYIDVYCHRRTDTKRIFPSLYDMFVGGVSVSGEDSKLTASREVGEELGLKRALHCIEEVSSSLSSSSSYSPLSDPLFKCTICTSYNRCIVTVFTYKYESEKDEDIKWQEEEVSWGNFVPYHIVEQAASLSIGRLIKDDQWPGVGGGDDDDDNHALEMALLSTESKMQLDDNDDSNGTDNDHDHHWKEWDFVPDGLLVWIAWLNWLQEK